ncbi:4Fe-4S binding protein, partial [bacterium]
MFTARRIAQIVFFILFILLFLMAIYPTASKVPVDFILRLDPLIIVTSTISARAIIAKSMPALILIIVTFLLGRFFCGWICPLGTTIDGCDNAVNSKYRNESTLK